MSDLHQDIDDAAARLAFTSRFPTFAGGTYAFSSDDLAAGAWLAADHPLQALACLSVDVPATLRQDPLLLAHARCRILIEDALAVRGDGPREYA